MKIYCIMVCEKLEEVVSRTGKKLGFADYGASRVVGFFRHLGDAREALMSDACGLHETCYDFGCIEEVEEGIYRPGALMGWYRYDRGKGRYLPMDTPGFEGHVCGRTIG